MVFSAAKGFINPGTLKIKVKGNGILAQDSYKAGVPTYEAYINIGDPSEQWKRIGNEEYSR